jgi:hypothetical protein
MDLSKQSGRLTHPHGRERWLILSAVHGEAKMEGCLLATNDGQDEPHRPQDFWRVVLALHDLPALSIGILGPFVCAGG